MSASPEREGEGRPEAPVRHPVDWRDPRFHDEQALRQELERVFDLCHGCQRCVDLCHSFPTLFDLVDATESMDVSAVEPGRFREVVDHCYLCDLCYVTRCPYVPPHEWQIDFPHLMLRAKAVKFKKGEVSQRDRLLAATDAVGRFAGIPVVAQAVNAVSRNGALRAAMESLLGIHRDAVLPSWHSRTARDRIPKRDGALPVPVAAGGTRGRVALFATCYGNRNEPQIAEDLVAVFEHNDIAVTLVDRERCCGMPRLELGDLEGVARALEANLPPLLAAVERGYDIVAPIPSCVLMFRQELPLMFSDNEALRRVARAIFDPFDYLALRHREGLLRTDFRVPLGKVAWHAPCHQRVQNIGPRTREILSLVPGTTVESIERCAGHDGTYAVKIEFHEAAMRIGRPAMEAVRNAGGDHFCSDCPMAGVHIAAGVGEGGRAEHPLTLLRIAYGL